PYLTRRRRFASRSEQTSRGGTDWNICTSIGPGVWRVGAASPRRSDVVSSAAERILGLSGLGQSTTTGAGEETDYPHFSLSHLHTLTFSTFAPSPSQLTFSLQPFLTLAPPCVPATGRVQARF